MTAAPVAGGIVSRVILGAGRCQSAERSHRLAPPGRPHGNAPTAPCRPATHRARVPRATRPCCAASRILGASSPLNILDVGAGGGHKRFIGQGAGGDPRRRATHRSTRRFRFLLASRSLPGGATVRFALPTLARCQGARASGGVEARPGGQASRLPRGLDDDRRRRGAVHTFLDGQRAYFVRHLRKANPSRGGGAKLPVLGALQDSGAARSRRPGRNGRAVDACAP